MINRSSVLTIAGALALGITALIGSQAALADGPAEIAAGQKTVLSFQEPLTDGTGLLSLSARLRNGDRPLGNQHVDFFVGTDFFDQSVTALTQLEPGEQQVYLGSGVTDATGTATISYQPRWSGTHAITAVFPGKGEYSATEAKLTLDVSGAPAYAPEPPGLEPLRQWAPVVIGLGVLGVWAGLLFVGIRTVRGISHARSS